MPSLATTAKRTARSNPTAVFLFVLFAIMAAAVSFHDRNWAELFTAHKPMLNQFLDIMHVFGGGHTIILIALALGAMGKRRTAVDLIVAVVVASAIVWIFKPAVWRIRPSGKDFSFPSGDAAVAATLIVPLLARRWWTLLGTLPIVLIVAADRMAHNYHYASDTMAGIAVGILGGLIAQALVDRYWLPAQNSRWRLHRAGWLGLAVAAAVLGCFGVLGDEEDVLSFLTNFGPAMALLVAAAWLPMLAKLWRGKFRALTSRPWLAAALIVLAVVAVYMLLASPCALFDRDEPRYAKATAEMLTSGNFAEPTFNGEYRLHKPPAIYWLMAGAVKLIGRSELAFRLPSIVATGLSLLLLCRIQRRLLGGSGAWAMLILATSTIMMMAGTWAITDAVLLLTVVAAMTLFVDDLLVGPRWWRTLLAGAIWGASLLVKGPVGVGVILASIGLSWWLTPRDSKLTARYWLHILVALVIGVGVILAWAIPTNIATGGKLVEVVNEQFVQRLFTPMEGHGGAFWPTLPFYLPVLIVGFLPWTMLLGSSASAAMGGRAGGRPGRAIIIGWALPTFVIMSLVATKLPHYILPMFPALALAAAGLLNRTDDLTRRERAWLVHGDRTFAIMVGLGGGVLAGAPVAMTILVGLGFPEMRDVMEAGLAGGLVLLAMAMAQRPLNRFVHLRTKAAVLVLSVLVVSVTMGFICLPRLANHQFTKPLAADLNARFAQTPVFTCDFDEPSLLFYLNRPEVIDNIDWHQIPAWAQDDSPALLITTAEEIDELRQRRPLPATMIKVARTEGFNYSKGRWRTVLVYARNIPHAQHERSSHD